MRSTCTSRIPARRSGCAIGCGLTDRLRTAHCFSMPHTIVRLGGQTAFVWTRKKPLRRRSRRRVDYFSRRETSRHNQSPRDREQRGLGRQGWQDALHYGQHQCVPHQVESSRSEDLSLCSENCVSYRNNAPVNVRASPMQITARSHGKRCNNKRRASQERHARLFVGFR